MAQVESPVMTRHRWQEVYEFIDGLFGPAIDQDVRSRIRHERAPFVTIAKEWASKYRAMRNEDPALPPLYIDDFKDYLRRRYLVGSDMFYKLEPKKR